MTLFGPDPGTPSTKPRHIPFDYSTLHKPTDNPTTLRRVFDVLVKEPECFYNARAISVASGLRIGACVDALKMLMRLHQVTPIHNTQGSEYTVTSNALRSYREGHREGIKRL